MMLPDTIYVDGKPYRVLQGALRQARDGVVRDARGALIREPCVDPSRALSWLDSGAATEQEPLAPSSRKKATKKGGA